MRRLLANSLFPVVAIVAVFAAAAGAPAADDHAQPSGSDAHGKAESGDSGHDEHGSGEVPLNWKSDLALWSLVVFVVFVFVLGKFAWGPLASGLDAREQRIREDIAAAEEARHKAEAMLAQHTEKLNKVQEEVREILAEARRDADHTRQDITNEAQREAEATKQRAINEINRARDAALKDLFDVMASQVASATEHVLGRSLSAADQDRLIDEALAQFSSK